MKRNLLQSAISKKAIVSTLDDGTPIVGEIIDRRGYQSAILGLNIAAATGSPTAPVAALTIWHDTASNMASEALYATLAATLDIKNAIETNYNIDLARANRYIRFKYDATYSDGSSPKNQVAANCILGDKSSGPVTASITVTQ